jgi:AraC-like DNA-binding protein
MRKFIAELSASCERERSVEYYAKQLGITPKYLSLICKKKVGKNASKVIDGAVVNKAKELLTQSGLSIQEVSERLNFVSQSFFGKYFKQRTGISPSRYKVQG